MNTSSSSSSSSRNHLKYVPPSSLTSVLLCIYVILFVLPSPSPQILCCSGLLQQKYPTRTNKWDGLFDVRRVRSRADRNNNYLFQINSSFDYSSTISTTTTNSKSKLEKDGGVAYRQSVCTSQEMELMQKETSLVMKHHLTKERSSIAQNRLGATLSRADDDNNSGTIRILEEGSIYVLAQRLASSSSSSSHNNNNNNNNGNGNGERKIQLAREIPVEVRLYEKVGASMAWHQDDIMYDPPQLELVFTLENNSDCVTMWKKQQNNDEIIHSQETHFNSMLLLLAGGPDHCVTSLKRGRRVILKCAYVYEGATYVGEEDCNQFGKAKRTSSSKSKKRKRNASKR